MKFQPISQSHNPLWGSHIADRQAPMIAGTPDQTMIKRAKPMKDTQTQTAVIWGVDRVEFLFDDQKSYERWKRHPKIEFELNLANADDYGESVLDKNETSSSCLYEVTPEIADIDIEFNERGPVISCEIDVLMAFKNGLTQEALSTWHDDFGGWAAATITIDDHASWADNQGSWFHLANVQVCPNPISLSDEIPF